MADNVGITTGTDASIATDDVGGVQYQRVKLDKGGDGVSSPVVAGSGLPVAVEANASTTAATFAQAVNTIAAAATPEALVASQTLVESVLIQAKKGFNSANTSAVFVGFSSTNDSNYLELLPGDSVTLKAPQGKKLDLNLIYIECVTAGDGVTYTSVN
jgi:hypothetical protein